MSHDEAQNVSADESRDDDLVGTQTTNIVLWALRQQL